MVGTLTTNQSTGILKDRVARRKISINFYYVDAHLQVLVSDIDEESEYKPYLKGNICNMMMLKIMVMMIGNMKTLTMSIAMVRPSQTQINYDSSRS